MSDPSGAAVRFEVLGPLLAWHGGSPVELGPIQQRVVLAVLLLQANRPIGRDQLIHAVWGDSAPAYAVNLLQKHVSGLRRLLRAGPPSAARLTWTDAGYLLKVPPGGSDLELFDRELARARAAEDAGDLRQAAAALHAATRLWRGGMCAGLSSPFIDVERDRLAERRLNAVEDRIDVDLRLGGGGELVEELWRLVADHPLRERLRGHLMLALYRSGRRAEAMAEFRRARHDLREELGVDPAAQLQRLHQQIVTADPALDAHPPAPPAGSPAGTLPSRAAIPAQLPPDQPGFAGRDTDLARLDAVVADDAGGTGGGTARMVVITGTAGVGKTTLAVHWAHRIRDRFPGGQLYANLQGFDQDRLVDSGAVLREFLLALGVPPQFVPDRLAAQTALYRSLLAGRRMLVVLDNARDSNHARPLLPGAAGCLTVITSRNDLTSLIAVEGARPLSLDVMTDADAYDVLTRRLGAERVTAEPDATADIIAACARLPLALAIVGARAAVRPRFPLAAVAGQLRIADSVLDPFSGEDRLTDVRAVFSWSYRQLGDAAARLFRLLGLHPGPDITDAAAASLSGTSREKTRRSLVELARVHLVVERLPGRFQFHDLLRAYAVELVYSEDTELDRQAAARRVLDHYLHTAFRADQLLNPHRDDAIQLASAPADAPGEHLADHGAAMAWFAAEHHVLIGIIKRTSGFDVHLVQLTWALSPYLAYSGYWQERVGVHEIALAAARRLGDVRSQANTQRLLGTARINLGRYDRADSSLRAALDLYGELADRSGQALVHRNIAWALERQGRHQEALSHAIRALEHHQRTGNLQGQGRALNAVGWFHAQLGDHQQARAQCNAALDLQRELGDRLGQAESWDSLGYIHRRLGDYPAAIACYRRAAALYHELGDRYNEADSLISLGVTHDDAGEVEPTRHAWQAALAILDPLRHPDAESVRVKLDKLPGAAE